MNHAGRGLSRREFSSLIASAGSALAVPSVVQADDAAKFKPRYILASCMYGYLKLAEIVPEVREIGATAIDIWPKVHGNQREQLDEMGETAFTALLNKHNIALGCITQYKLGPFGLQQELQLARRLGCRTMVTGGQGPKGLQGGELKSAMAGFVEKMKPHLAVAEENHVTIAIENHSHNLVDSPDALKWLAELRPSKHLGIALAPYHLPQNERLLADLIRSLGDSIAVFYAWQHGMGCMKKLPKAQELLQMPGRGSLDFAPLLSALQDIHYRGWTEIFMHPVPRGIPILQTATAVSAEINRSRAYLAGCLKTP